MKKRNLSLSALFVAFLLCVSVPVHAQERYVKNLQGYNNQPYHFGFVLGADQMLFSLKTVNRFANKIWGGSVTTENEVPGLDYGKYYRVRSVFAQSSPGFSVGIIGNLLLQRYVDLRFIPTIAFGSRTLVYKIEESDNSSFPSKPLTFTEKKPINSTYLIFPLLLKYRSWRRNNVGAYFLGGMSYSIDMAAVKKINKNARNLTGIVKTKVHDEEVQLGAGFDFYTQYFKLGVEAKMLYGLNNLIVNENDIFSGSISQLHSKVFMLSFTFE